MTEKNIRQENNTNSQIKDELQDIKFNIERNNLFWDIYNTIAMFETKGCVCDIYIQLRQKNTWKTPQQLMLGKKDIIPSSSNKHLKIILENECFIININDIQEICIKAHKI